MKKYTEEQSKYIDFIANKYKIGRKAVLVRLRKANYDFSKIDYPIDSSHIDCRHIKYWLDGRPAIEIAKENGINSDKFQQRIQAGYSIRRAATFHEPSLKEIVLKTGLSFNRVCNLVYVKGFSKEQVIKGEVK